VALSRLTKGDAVGRPYKVVFSDNNFSQSSYNSAGQLSKTVDPDGVTTLYQYNSKGELVVSALDADSSGTIGFSGTDRINSTLRDVTTINSVNIVRTRNYQWQTPSSAASNLVSETRVSTDGLNRWQIAFGLTNRSQMVYTGSGDVYVTNTAPDGSYTVTYSKSGQTGSVTAKDANGTQLSQTTSGYDAHGRLSTSTDARNGATTYGYDNADRLTSVTTPPPGAGQSGLVTTTAYDKMGWVTNVTQPDSGAVRTIFRLTGEIATNSGSRTYPVAYTYDFAGRLKTMKTWTDFSSGAGAAKTTWNYHANRGFLTSKSYADSTGPTYTNTAAGRLKGRTWVRGTNTTYSYNTLGDLAAITYTGGTSNAGFGYDRAGRRTFVTNGTDVTAFSLNEAGLVASESYSGGPLSGLAVTNVYDSLLRRTTNGVVSTSGTWLVRSTNSFDAASRLSYVSDGSNSATYAYVTDSPLVSSITGWTTLATGITATSFTASTVDNSDNPQRFYRVLLRQ
jgi:YD repeat-containing protein